MWSQYNSVYILNFARVGDPEAPVPVQDQPPAGVALEACGGDQERVRARVKSDRRRRHGHRRRPPHRDPQALRRRTPLHRIRPRAHPQGWR